MSEIFSLKLFTPPVVIGLVSLAERRWGSMVSGWLIGLPLTSGPVIYFLAREQGNTFAAKASEGIIAGQVSLSLFCLTYAWLSVRYSWMMSVVAGWSAYLICVLALNMISISLAIVFVAVFTFVIIVYSVLPQIGTVGSPVNLPAWEIPLRMVASTLLVISLTETAHILGPQLSGLLIPFPVYSSVLAVFTHKFQGSHTTVHLLRGVVAGSFSFAVFFLVIAGFIESWGIAASFSLAIIAAMLVHGAAFWILKKT